MATSSKRRVTEEDLVKDDLKKSKVEESDLVKDDGQVMEDAKTDEAKAETEEDGESDMKEFMIGEHKHVR